MDDTRASDGTKNTTSADLVTSLPAGNKGYGYIQMASKSAPSAQNVANEWQVSNTVKQRPAAVPEECSQPLSVYTTSFMATDWPEDKESSIQQLGKAQIS